MAPRDALAGRLHIVMVPGFAGFDALGQLEYFAGVTRQFQQWREGSQAAHAVLHYFDNFPTSGRGDARRTPPQLPGQARSTW